MSNSNNNNRNQSELGPSIALVQSQRTLEVELRTRRTEVSFGAAADCDGSENQPSSPVQFASLVKFDGQLNRSSVVDVQFEQISRRLSSRVASI